MHCPCANKQIKYIKSDGVQWLWLLIVLCQFGFYWIIHPVKAVQIISAHTCAHTNTHTHTANRHLPAIQTQTFNIPWKARHGTTFLALPVTITIATLSSLPRLSHWLEERHGYTDAAKNLNELNDTLPGLYLILPFTTSHTQARMHAHTHTHKRTHAYKCSKWWHVLAEIHGQYLCGAGTRGHHIDKGRR